MWATRRCVRLTCIRLLLDIYTLNNRHVNRRSQHSRECKNPRREKPNVACVYTIGNIELCLKTLWPWPWPFEPKVNRPAAVIVEHLCVKFGEPSCIDFWDIVRKIQTGKKRWKSYPCATAVDVGYHRNKTYF